MFVMFLFRHIYESNNLSAAAIYYCAGLYLHVTLVLCIANSCISCVGMLEGEAV